MNRLIEIVDSHFPLPGSNVTVRGTADELQGLFLENAQFAKQPIRIPATPDAIISIINREPIDGTAWETTTSCTGGLVNFAISTWGMDEGLRIIAATRDTLLKYTGREIYVNPDITPVGVRR